MQVQIMGIAWYREHDYPEILRIMADAHVLPMSYREWEQKAERLERETSSRGVRAVRAIIDPKAFPSWCQLRGLKVDANARMQFANAEAYRIGRG
ncbi:hypothetical protein [Mesorhizobium sp. B2-5-9]|uniref:hypothetical protein n=1 Tax=Mesorhizobium sp. B2-5-9 TaxID=2589921 RepID=UPI001FEED5CC|nr:hypothetical protein [Mesorhizobium sp. B2-5-9]